MNPPMNRQWPALDARAKREGRQSRSGQSKSSPVPAQASWAEKARGFSFAKGAGIHEAAGRLREDGPKAIAAPARAAVKNSFMILQWPALDGMPNGAAGKTGPGKAKRVNSDPGELSRTGARHQPRKARPSP